MSQYSRFIGIDVGLKRIGLARTDLLRTVANPFGTYGPDEIFDVLDEQVESETVTTFVVGWPLELDGSEGDAIDMVKTFIEKLRERYPQVTIEKVDERFTSKQAVQKMIEAGVPKMKRRNKKRIDRAAAAIILQNYLEIAY